MNIKIASVQYPFQVSSLFPAPQHASFQKLCSQVWIHPSYAWHPPHWRVGSSFPRRQMESMDIDCPASSMAPYFPPNVVETIARHLWKGDRAPLFDVMSMAGVCRDWRDVCSVVPRNLGLDVCLTLDCLEAAQPLSKRAAHFRRASLGAQRAFLAGAAKLLRGPGLTGCILRGPGASDGLVLQVRASSTSTRHPVTFCCLWISSCLTPS